MVLQTIKKPSKIKGFVDWRFHIAHMKRDATACCAQGIEFVLTEDYVYPDDYPEVDEEICVVGVFDTYQEGDYT